MCKQVNKKEIIVGDKVKCICSVRQGSGKDTSEEVAFEYWP